VVLSRRARLSPEHVVERYARQEPDVVALAEIVSLAITVDPALLRAARRRFVDHRGPDLEADLWHSSLVDSSNTAGIVLDDAIAECLRVRLAPRTNRYHQARALIIEEHGGRQDPDRGWLPDTLRVEEELRYLALVFNGHERARQLLAEVTRQIEEMDAPGLQVWQEGLHHRLPASLRPLTLGTVPGDGPASEPVASPPGVVIGVRLLDDAVELRATPHGSMHRLALPAGAPVAVFIEEHLVPLQRLPRTVPLADGREVTVQSLDGTTVRLRRHRREPVPPAPAALTAPADSGWGCAYAPDGTLLAATAQDGTVRLWDPQTGAAVHILRAPSAHRGPVERCAFSPDGRRLATTGRDGTVCLWDPSAGTHLRTLDDHGDAAEGCAFSPDGTLLATTSKDRTVRLRDPADGTPVLTLTGHTNSVWACAFSPDGSLLATTDDDGGVRLWDPATGAALLTLTGHADSVEGCAFSPDGTLLATTSRDRTVRLWDPVDGTAQHTLTGHTNSVWACAFSPDGTLLASVGNDGTVRLWDPVAATLLRTFTGPAVSVRACAFSPDGSRLATLGADRAIRLWEVSRVRPWRTLIGHRSWVNSCAYSPDGLLLASAGNDGEVRLWDPPTRTPVHTLAGHRGSVWACAFSPDGTQLASTGSDGRVRLWDPATGDAQHDLAGHVGGVRVGAYSPDGSVLATAGADHSVRLWDPVRGTLRQVIEGHTGAVLGCAFSPDGRLLASVGNDQSVRLWDPATGRPVRTLDGHIREVLACAFSPLGSVLATGSLDQSVRLWDPVTGRQVRTLRGHANHVHSCAFSPDGSVLATAGADGTVRLWEDLRRPAQASLRRTLTDRHEVLACAFSPDGTMLVTSGADHVVRVWDLLTGDLAAKGDTVALWLGGRPGDEAAVAGAVAARPHTARCTPVVASGGGAVPGVLLAAGADPREVRDLVVATSIGRPAITPLDRRWAIRRLARELSRHGISHTGHLRVPVAQPLHAYRFHAVVLDHGSGDVVVLPRDAPRLGLDADAIPLAPLALAASGAGDRSGPVAIGGRWFSSAVGHPHQPAPWFRDFPMLQPLVAVDVEDAEGSVPPRRFAAEVPLTRVTIPWLHLTPPARPSRRRREVLARIGEQSMRAALADDQATAGGAPRPGRLPPRHRWDGAG
jgi:WD40 repeat protein